MYKNILVAISHGSNSYNLFQIGLDLALKYKAQMTLCHIKNLKYIIPNFANENVYMPQDIIYFETNDGIEDTLNKYRDEALVKGVLKVDVVVTASSTPALAITNVVVPGFGCDLIICGSSKSKGIFKKIFGNVTGDILKNTSVDVLIVKDKEERD
ncbi:MAG TPA: universal stress protein [Haloplasmataceae bacterium]